MKISYNNDNNYYLLNDTIIIDIESSLICAQLKNKSFDCLKIIDNEWYYYNYKSNEKLINILFPKDKFSSFKFINNNINDYRKENIELKYNDKYYDIFDRPPGYNILKIGTSNKVEQGKFSGQYRNMYWKVQDNENTYYLMHIVDNIYTKISKRDIKKVLNFNGIRPFWYLNNNGYVATTIQEEKKSYYLHQYIMNVHTEDLTSYEKTIDHINRDKLDNRQSNLRFANMSEQNSNRDKSARRCDAKTELPEWLEELPKYVQFRREVYNKDTGDVREFFIIQHPSLDKIWESSKSINVLTSDKFKATKLKLQLIENLITEKQYNKESGFNDIIDLPKYLVIICRNESKCFSYDYKNDTGDRYTQKIVIKSQDIQSELNKFIECLNTKYPDLKFPNYIIQNKKACSKLGSQIIVKDDIKSDIQIKIDNMKKELPPNFSIGNEKGTLYLSFSKNIDGKRHSMKRVMKSDNVKNELTNLIEELNCKYKLQFNI